MTDEDDLAVQRSQGAIPKRRHPQADRNTVPAGGSGDYSNTVELSRRLLAILLDPDNMEVHNLVQLKEELKQEMASK